MRPGSLQQAGAEFGGMAADSEFAHHVFKREPDDQRLRHQSQDTDDLGFTLHSGEVDHAATGRKHAIIRAVRLEYVTGQVVILVPAGNDLFGSGQSGVDEDERRVVFKESTAVKAIEWSAKDLNRVGLAYSEEIGQSKAFGAKPGDTISIVLNQKAGHDKYLDRARPDLVDER